MRFGQNAVKTPGGARENHCVTKGLKFRAALFKGWQVQGGALVALRRGRNTLASLPEGAFFFAYFLFERKKESKSLLALHPATLQIHPSGVFCNLSPLN